MIIKQLKFYNKLYLQLIVKIIFIFRGDKTCRAAAARLREEGSAAVGGGTSTEKPTTLRKTEHHSYKHILFVFIITHHFLQLFVNKTLYISMLNIFVSLPVRKNENL